MELVATVKMLPRLPLATEDAAMEAGMMMEARGDVKVVTVPPVVVVVFITGTAIDFCRMVGELPAWVVVDTRIT